MDDYDRVAIGLFASGILGLLMLIALGCGRAQSSTCSVYTFPAPDGATCYAIHCGAGEFAGNCVK